MDETLYKVFLDAFLREFDYDKSDRDFLMDTYERVVNSERAKAIFDNVVEHYDNDEHCDYDSILYQSEEVAMIIKRHKYTTDLLIFILLSRRLLERYEERGYSHELWHNTMMDLKYKLTECKLVKGTIGSFVAGWFPGFFRLERFAFGRLQFELVPFRGKYGILDENVKMIGMHIPRDGTPLSPEKCREAFFQAKEWYRGQATEIDGKNVFYCDSWLLYPMVIPYLSSKSNIRKFFELFDVYGYNESFNSGNMWRLFDTDEINPDKLPANSSLRQLYIARMKEGLPFGEGTGIFYL